MDPIFIPKKGLKILADSCLLYKKADGTREKLSLDVHQHSYLFYVFNHSIPPSDSPLAQTELPDATLRLAFHCVLMSYLAYEDRTQIEFPPDVPIVYEAFESDVTKIPFFICIDKEVNAIIIACRGSSCTDDFVTDSMGNGVNFDGGKIHQGIFQSASYVFMKCRDVILDLNRNYNGEYLLRKNTSRIDLSATKKSEEALTQFFYDESQTDCFKLTKKKKMKIIFTGHSLGGGVAAVVAYFFRNEYPKIDVEAMCFAPPPTFSFKLWNKSAHFIKSFMIEGDLVPFLSLQNVVKFTKMMFPHHQKFIQKKIEQYLQKHTVNELSKSFWTDKMYPPGQCYLIRLPQTNPNKKKKDKRKANKYQKREIKEKSLIKCTNICLCQIYNPDYFSNFVKNIQETNHKCKNYMKVIARLKQQQIQEKNIDEIFKRKQVYRPSSSFDETEESGVERLV